MFCLLTCPLRWKCASSLKKIKSRKLGWSSIRRLMMLWQDASLSALFAAIWACRIVFVWKHVKVLVHYPHNRCPGQISLLRQTSCGFPWRIAKCSLTLSMMLSALPDLSRLLWPLFLSWILPVSLNLFKRRRIVTLVGAFLPGKSLQNCLYVWMSNLVVK